MKEERNLAQEKQEDKVIVLQVTEKGSCDGESSKLVSVMHLGIHGEPCPKQ